MTKWIQFKIWTVRQQSSKQWTTGSKMCAHGEWTMGRMRKHNSTPINLIHYFWDSARNGEWEEEKVCKQCLSNRNFHPTDKHIFESIDLAQIGLWSMWMKQWKRNDVNWKKNWHFKTKSINKSQNVCTQRRMQGKCARERSKANIDINHNAYELIHFCFHRRCPTQNAIYAFPIYIRRIHSKFEIWHYIYRSGQFNVKTSWNWPI